MRKKKKKQEKKEREGIWGGNKTQKQGKQASRSRGSRIASLFCCYDVACNSHSCLYLGMLVCIIIDLRHNGQ